jgi:hypothetical protein
MQTPVMAQVQFDIGCQSRVVYVKEDTDPQVILELLDLNPLPKGIVSISGGADKFPSEAEERAAMLLEEVIVPIVYQYELLVVDGGTEAGIMEITGKKIEARSPGRITIGDTERGSQNVKLDFRTLPLLGFAPEARVDYPGAEPSLRRDSNLDPNHLYFVLVCETDWGGEVECMFSFLDYLATRRQIPVINIVANGGRITIKEVYHAVEKGWPVIVLEGSSRAAQLIVAALNGVPEREMPDLFDRYQVEISLDEVPEVVHWLSVIAEYEQVIRFDLFSRLPDELAMLILSRLGLTV